MQEVPSSSLGGCTIAISGPCLIMQGLFIIKVLFDL